MCAQVLGTTRGHPWAERQRACICVLTRIVMVNNHSTGSRLKSIISEEEKANDSEPGTPVFKECWKTTSLFWKLVKATSCLFFPIGTAPAPNGCGVWVPSLPRISTGTWQPGKSTRHMQTQPQGPQDKRTWPGAAHMLLSTLKPFYKAGLPKTRDRQPSLVSKAGTRSPL